MQNSTSHSQIIGSNIMEFSEVVSTNLTATELIKKGPVKEGTCVFAAHQTSGRGQQNTSWESAPFENLTFSVILTPEFLHVEKQFLLNQCISLGIYDLLNKYFEPKVSIKWPNDIYVGHRKISGILIENTIISKNLKSCIAGIGLNVNQSSFSEDIPNPTSFKLLTGKSHDLTDLRNELLLCLNARYLQLKKGRHTLLNLDYMNALYRLNRPYLFKINGAIEEGTITGVNNIGQLMVMFGNEVRHFNHKEIRYLIEIWN